MGGIDYQHYIITRFNVKQNDWAKDKNNNALTLTDNSWLKERFELFETYCLPSVRAQTCQDFKWLVYFDTDTPENYKNRIQSYQSSFPNLLPKFIPGMEHLISSIKKDISHGSDKTIITTRLDNDDSINEVFIERVQSLIKSKQIEKGIIDVPNGYCLQVKPKPILSKSIQHSNAFITYVEPYTSSCELVTVMHIPHSEWAYSVKTFIITRERLWIQIIHEKNVVNKVKGIIINDEKSLTGFNLDTKIAFNKNTLQQDIFNICVKGPTYCIKKSIKKNLIKLRIILRKIKK